VADGVYWASLEPVHLPNETNIWMFSSKLGDYLTSNIDKQQFYSPFIISSSFNMLSKKRNNKIKGNQAVTLGQDYPPNLIPRSVKKKVDAEHTIKNIEEKKKLVQFSLNVLVSGKNKKEVKRSVDTVKSYWDSGQPQQRIKLEMVERIVPINFFASLPLGMNSEYSALTENNITLFADEAAQFIPSEADWSGTKTPTIPLISRRGQLIEFDLFDSPDNYNGYIVATSGAGKSVFINYMTLMYLAKGDTVFTFDIGRSYEKLCNSIDGQWIEFDLNKPISINPFSEIKTQEDFDENWDYLRDFIYFIGASMSKEYSDQVEKLIKSYIDGALKELWNEYRDKLEVSHISTWFLGKGKEERELVNFGQQLTPFTATGIYGKFFTGKSDIDFTKPYVVMELDTIENIQELRDAVIMIMIFHITRTTYSHGAKKTRTICFIDEAHKFLGTSHKIDIFIEQAYRRFRKHGASIVIATQGFDDIYSVNEKSISRAGRVIINSSSWKFFLKQTEESINALKLSQLISFSDMDYHVLRSITNYKPYHSEVFINTPFGVKVVARIMVDRFMYYLFTTFMEDKIRIQNYTDQGLSMVEAIKAVIKEDEEREKK
jgi:conjugal transfer ATP-binding protein TraC